MFPVRNVGCVRASSFKLQSLKLQTSFAFLPSVPKRFYDSLHDLLSPSVPLELRRGRRVHCLHRVPFRNISRPQRRTHAHLLQPHTMLLFGLGNLFYGMNLLLLSQTIQIFLLPVHTSSAYLSIDLLFHSPHRLSSLYLQHTTTSLTLLSIVQSPSCSSTLSQSSQKIDSSPGVSSSLGSRHIAPYPVALGLTHTPIVGWSAQSFEPSFGSSADPTSIKAKMVNLIASVRTLMRSESSVFCTLRPNRYSCLS